MEQTIYVELLNEAVACWRPVKAVHKRGDVYTIVSPNPDPEFEHWEFSTGEDVRCAPSTFSEGRKVKTVLKAFAKAE